MKLFHLSLNSRRKSLEKTLQWQQIIFILLLCIDYKTNRMHNLFLTA